MSAGRGQCGAATRQTVAAAADRHLGVKLVRRRRLPADSALCWNHDAAGRLRERLVEKTRISDLTVGL